MNRFIYGSSIIFLHYKTLTESPTPSQVQHMQRQRQKPWNMSSSKCKNLSTHFWPSHIHGVGGVCWYENLHCLHSPKADSRWKVVSSFNTLAKAQVARFWTLFHLFFRGALRVVVPSNTRAFPPTFSLLCAPLFCELAFTPSASLRSTFLSRLLVVPKHSWKFIS